MANGLPYFIKKDGDSLLFDCPGKEMVAYIPEKYFERNIAEQVGDSINLVGVFDYTVQDIETGKNDGLRRFKFPTIFSTRPGSTEKVKQIKLIKESKPLDYRILRYRQDDTIVMSTKITQFIGNVEKVNNLFLILGFINNTIPYDKIHDYLLDAAQLNGFGYGLNNQMFGFVISELCRSNKDIKVPFRLSGSNDMHDYQSCSVRNVSKFTSPYTALISEDFDESILYAMLNETPKDTPLEKVLVGPN